MICANALKLDSLADPSLFGQQIDEAVGRQIYAIGGWNSFWSMPSGKRQAQFVWSPQGVDPLVKWSYNPLWAAAARTKLMQAPWTHHSDAFSAIDQSFGIVPWGEMDHDQFATVNHEGNKNLLKIHDAAGKNCIVYGAGIADDSSFEEKMAKMGCEVHAFDCTLRGNESSVTGKKFQFHNWCLGTPASFEENNYAKNQKGWNYAFFSVSEAMKKLGHQQLDVLKFDIEGFEWNLFENDLLKGLLTTKARPKQLTFELHTAGANAGAVPHDVVAGKDYKAVDNLFAKLYDLGYRVISKERNPYDPHCAEFVLVDVFNL